MRKRLWLGLLIAAGWLGLAAGAEAQQAVPTKPGFERIKHILVIYLENRSFDNLYGLFPKAEGIAAAAGAAPQVDLDGKIYDHLPPVLDTGRTPPAADPRFPADLPNQPFKANNYASLDKLTADLVHRFYQEQIQIDGGRMDKFAAASDAAGLSMAYYDGRKLPLWDYARRYVLADHFFHAAFGGSFLNHFWLICACTPRYAELDAGGKLIKDGAVTPDGYAVNTIQTVFAPHSAKITDKSELLPPQGMPTIGDRLSEKGIGWAWYSGGWDDAVAGHPDKLFQFHHQPFAYFARYGDGTPDRAAHLKDETAMMAAIADGSLPSVSFFKPIGEQNEHPGYAAVLAGDSHAVGIIRKLQRSKLWKDMAIIVTYDENGGQWDHVAPPAIDRWGPGTRVPTLIISPFAKHSFIDHTVYDTTSILKFIEMRFNLVPLGSRDAAAADLSNAFALK